MWYDVLTDLVLLSRVITNFKDYEFYTGEGMYVSCWNCASFFAFADELLQEPGRHGCPPQLP